MVGFEISPLEWDTDFFNMKCGKLVILECNQYYQYGDSKSFS